MLAGRSRLKAKGMVSAASYWAVGQAVLDSLPFAGPGHAGHFETSGVLALRPDLPQLDARYPEDARPCPLASMGKINGIAVRYPGIWEASDGVSDAADMASAELGAEIVDGIAKATAEFLLAFHEQPLLPTP